MNYILSDGPYSELNEKEGIEYPVWFVTEYDENDEEVQEHGKFFSQESTIEHADRLAKRKHIKHIREAGRA